MRFRIRRLLCSCLLFSSLIKCGRLNDTLAIDPLVAPVRLSSEEIPQYQDESFRKTSFLTIAVDADSEILNTLKRLAVIYFPSQSLIEDKKTQQLSLEEEALTLTEQIASDSILDRRIEALKMQLRSARRDHKRIKSEMDACNREKARRAEEAVELRTMIQEIQEAIRGLQEEMETLKSLNHKELQTFSQQGGRLEPESPESFSLSFNQEILTDCQLVWKKYADGPLTPVMTSFQPVSGDLKVIFEVEERRIELKMNVHPTLQTSLPKHLARLQVIKRGQNKTPEIEFMGFLYLQH